MTRYQDSKQIVKLWRLRHYVYIPFRFISWKLRDNEFHYKDMWKILIGSAQCDMNWTYTTEEVKEYIKTKQR